MTIERKEELIKDIVTTIVRKLNAAKVSMEEYPVTMAEIMHLFMISWAQINGIPDYEAIGLIKEMTEAVERIVNESGAN